MSTVSGTPAAGSVSGSTPVGSTPAGATSPALWWRGAVVYAVYPTSFADGDGDGIGDLRGLRERLDHIADLGADAIWLCPWNPSPMADGGYDVSDYCDINPMLGTLDEARALIDDVHARGMRLIVDLVANHTSNQHPWFQAALAAGRGSTERERYLFRDGRGEHGERPPNGWISAFGDSGWTRVTEPDGSPGQWYFHTFAPEQPDLDWSREQVRADFDDIMRFWFDLGVDGLRVDAAPAMAKEAGLPDYDLAAYGDPSVFRSSAWVDSPQWDTPGIHDIMRRFRSVAREYGEDRMFVAEAVVSSSERLADYVRPDELNTAFNFQFLKEPWGPGLRAVIDETLRLHAEVGAPPTWCLSSHDEVRLATRLGRPDTTAVHMVDPATAPTDLELGRRRARAALLLMLALPGSCYLYQGEELGLPYVADLPVESLRDPVHRRSGGTIRGRDGSRVPMPWSGDRPPFGFSTNDDTWFPMPADWADLTVAAEEADPGSTLHLLRAALRLRRAQGAPEAALAWRASDPAVLDFERLDRHGAPVRCVLNLSGAPVPIDDGWEVTLSSIQLLAATLPHDATAWLRRVR